MLRLLVNSLMLGYLLGEDRAQEIEPPQVEAYFAQNHNIDSTNTLWPL